MEQRGFTDRLDQGADEAGWLERWSLKSILSIDVCTGFIELRGGSQGDDFFEGNIFVDGEAVCDDKWGREEAAVVCR